MKITSFQPEKINVNLSNIAKNTFNTNNSKNNNTLNQGENDIKEYVNHKEENLEEGIEKIRETNSNNNNNAEAAPDEIRLKTGGGKAMEKVEE
jgi:hypothetical protein